MLDGLPADESAKEMALRQGLSVMTVQDHTKRLYKRLNVNGRGDLLARFSRKQG